MARCGGTGTGGQMREDEGRGLLKAQAGSDSAKTSANEKWEKFQGEERRSWARHHGTPVEWIANGYPPVLNTGLGRSNFPSSQR